MGKRGKTRERKGSARKSRGASSITSRDRPRSHQIGALRKREKTKPSAWLFGHLLVEASSKARPRPNRGCTACRSRALTLRGQGAGRGQAGGRQDKALAPKTTMHVPPRWSECGRLPRPPAVLDRDPEASRAMRCRFPCCCPVTQEAETARGVHVFRVSQWRVAVCFAGKIKGCLPKQPLSWWRLALSGVNDQNGASVGGSARGRCVLGRSGSIARLSGARPSRRPERPRRLGPCG